VCALKKTASKVPRSRGAVSTRRILLDLSPACHTANLTGEILKLKLVSRMPGSIRASWSIVRIVETCSCAGAPTLPHRKRDYPANSCRRTAWAKIEASSPTVRLAVPVPFCAAPQRRARIKGCVSKRIFL
jgi:hypothetical protein